MCPWALLLCRVAQGGVIGKMKTGARRRKSGSRRTVYCQGRSERQGAACVLGSESSRVPERESRVIAKESDSRVAYVKDTSSPARSMEHHKVGGAKVAPGAFGSEARSRDVNLDGRSCCNQSSRPDARDGIFSDVGACL